MIVRKLLEVRGHAGLCAQGQNAHVRVFLRTFFTPPLAGFEPADWRLEHVERDRLGFHVPQQLNLQLAVRRLGHTERDGHVLPGL